MSMALQHTGAAGATGARTATFRPRLQLQNRLENDLNGNMNPGYYAHPLPTAPLLRQQISAAREEHRLSLGDMHDIPCGSGSETNDSSDTETDVSYMSDNEYDMEDMNAIHASRRPLTRPTLKLEPLNSHAMRKSVVSLEDVCDTVVSPVKSIFNGMDTRNEYFPETGYGDKGRYPLHIVVNDEHGGKMTLE